MQRFCGLLITLIALDPSRIALAQEVPAASAEKSYHELGRSKDTLIRGYAQRYLDLTKLQEWASARGSKISAKYVSHTPDLDSVTLSTVKGTGSARTTKEVTVDVAQLSKVCQSRVRQIDALQKKLRELEAKAKEEGKEGGEYGGPESGAPMVEERGVEPAAVGPESPAASPESPQPATPVSTAPAVEMEDPSPDPLGFSEISLTPGPEGAAGSQQASFSFSLPGVGAQPGPALQSGPVDRAQWRTSYPAFVSNITVNTDATGQPQIDWGEMRELLELNELARTKQDPSAPQPPEPANPAELAARIGEIHWQLALDQVVPSPEGISAVKFQGPELPQPLAIQFVPDAAESPQSWIAIPQGSPVSFKGRMEITQPNMIRVIMQLEQPNLTPEAIRANTPSAPENDRR